METFGYDVETFESGEAFLGSGLLDQTRCLIADVQMRGMSGPQLQEHLINSGIKIPVIFVTAFPRCNIRDRVMKQERLQRALGDEGKVNVLRSGDS